MTDPRTTRRSPSTLSAILHRAIGRVSASPSGTSPLIEDDAGFDWQVYLDSHRDLRKIRTAADALHHYNDVGRTQGRLASAPAIEQRIQDLVREYGPLPERFAWADYLSLYTDLKHIQSSYDAIEHFLRYGQREARLYARFDPDIYRSVHFPGVDMPESALLDHFREVGQPGGLIASMQQLAMRSGLGGKTWLERLDVAEFELLNARWAGPITDKQQALEAMIREGFDRVAPISFSAEFDPDYYRDANPGLGQLSPGLLYRQWLFEGMDKDRPGTAADHLRRHGLKLSAFPEGFDWQRYRGLRGVHGDSRWALLDHVVANNAIAADAIPVREPGAGQFLAALATTITDRVEARGEALFAAARRYGELSTADEEQWGKAFARQKRWDEALVHYDLALAQPNPTVTAAVAGAEAAAALDDYPRAVSILHRAGRTVGGDMRYRNAVRACLEAAFGAGWKMAETLYAAEQRARGDELLTALANDLARWWPMLDPTGLPVPPESPRRVVLLANVDLSQCTHYRVTQKQEIFATAGIPLAVYTPAEVADFISALPGAAAAIFYRLPALPMNVRAIGVARALGIATYYDIDDLIFEPAYYPEPIETYGSASPAFYHSLQLGVPLFRAAMALCDYAIASTSILAEHMAGVVRTGQTFVLPNGIDSYNQDYLTFALPKVRQNGDVVLFYGSGTKAHNSDFIELVGDALVTVMRRHSHVRLMIAGFLSLDARFEPVRDRIVQVDWIKDVRAYWSLLAEADISLAVLAPFATTDAKSEIKWLESSALGVASIVSATHRYREVLTDGVEALFARNADEWLSSLETLISDPARRAALVEAARAKARTFYSLAQNAERLKLLLAPAFANAASRALTVPRKKRVLLVNIFFPPQTIGGSTRVARDNLDSFLASPFAEDCEFAVVTTDNDNPAPFQLRVDDYRGVPVFRMSTPLEPNMEWRPFNPEVGRVFRRVLDIWRPDLVHVHSIQRSTASILEECWAKDIPYINTLHDAWWVADYHFLVDLKGRLRKPEESLPIDPPPPATLGDALERRRRLRILLEHSAEILCVSDAFTAIHRKAGYPRTRSVPNGVPAMPKVERIPSPSGRVRLTQVGSQTHHKGYHLIQAALKQSRFRNLELTVIEHGRFGGRVEETVWGETPVYFVGKTKQEEMHTFYATVDVLLAPSVWPESFGLVAREAIAAGLWVVASDRGAIGENVTPGVNGWVIDVSALDPLIHVLAEIDADPARYREPPPRVAGVQRTADDQAQDLIAIYREVLARPNRPAPRPYFMRGGFAQDPVKPGQGAMAQIETEARWP